MRPFKTRYYKRLFRNFAVSAQYQESLLVHGSPREPTLEYVMPQEFLMGDKSYVKSLFVFDERVCFCGHTHVPAILTESQHCFPGGENDQAYELGEEKVIVNVGSVGQPRDHDPRACYVELNGDTIIYHRITYPISDTQKKIRASGLHDRLADRLAMGR